MSPKPPEDKIRKIADASVLVLASRVIVPVIGGLCLWILTSVVQTQKDVSGILASVDGLKTRIETLERVTFQPYARNEK